MLMLINVINMLMTNYEFKITSFKTNCLDSNHRLGGFITGLLLLLLLLLCFVYYCVVVVMLL